MEVTTMWLLLLLMAGGMGMAGVALLRMRAVRRQRSNQWNDLRQRRQLFESQLRHLEDVQRLRVPPTVNVAAPSHFPPPLTPPAG